MAHLTSSLKSLTTPEDRLSAAEGLMAYVYGPYDPQKHTKEIWQPGELYFSQSAENISSTLLLALI